MNQIIVPLSAEEITTRWLSEALKIEISPKDFTLFTNVQAGSGFMSNVIRITCKPESDDKKVFNLIIKILPSDEAFNALVTSEKFDKTEIYFYEKIVPRLVEIVPDLKPYLCPFYYGNVQEVDQTKEQKYASVLILEDLKPQGYFTINFAGEESLPQLQGVVNFLAKFHYSGMVLEHQLKQPLPKVYDFIQGSELLTDVSMIFEMGRSGFIEIDSIFSNELNISKEVQVAYQQLAPYSDKMIKLIELASKKFPCLTHGDLNSNNLLFNNDSQFETKVIDWQMLGYMDPTYDLAVTIVSSLPKDQLNKEEVDQLLQLYYTTFSNQCKSGQVADLITRDWKSFSEYFYTWGMAYVFQWFLMTSKPFLNNLPRLVRIYEFLAQDMQIPKFLLDQLKK